MSQETISIIIPALNEGEGIEKTLKALINAQGLEDRDGIEIILADGGSRDDTVDKARPHCQVVIQAQRGRALQMNAGAEAATGDILFFLHADNEPPSGFASLIRTTLRKSDVVAGAFDISISARGAAYRLIERAANMRSRLTRIPYGDQGLFVRRATFVAMGGFREIPIMEDIEMGRRLRRMGRIAFLRPPNRTSARRWKGEGIVKATLRNWAIAIAYTVFRISPERLVRHYPAREATGTSDR